MAIISVFTEKVLFSLRIVKKGVEIRGKKQKEVIMVVFGKDLEVNLSHTIFSFLSSFFFLLFSLSHTTISSVILQY